MSEFATPHGVGYYFNIGPYSNAIIFAATPAELQESAAALLGEIAAEALLNATVGAAMDLGKTQEQAVATVRQHLSAVPVEAPPAETPAAPAQPAPTPEQQNAPPVNTDYVEQFGEPCEKCGTAKTKVIPAGVSRKTNKPYAAFAACPNNHR